MIQRRGFLATTVMFAVLGTAGAAWAGSGGEVQDLKREVARLRADVQTLQVAMTEAAELERQGAVKISKVLDAEPAAVEPAVEPAAAPVASAEVASSGRASAVAAPAAAADSKTKGSSHRRHHRHPRRSR
jgi:hypothetical protein